MKTLRTTSSKVANMLLEKASLTDNIKILEPSAGEGFIIDQIYENYNLSNLHIDCVELNKEKCEVMKTKGYNVHHMDFINYETDIKYNRIIAAPPFKGNIDLVHIMKMYTMLATKGIIVSLTAPQWITNNDPHQIEFRKWLEDKRYDIVMLPDNSFIEKRKSVHACIIRIFK